LPLPYLNLLSQFLTSLQCNDGSWFQEPLHTTIILQALHTYYSNVIKSKINVFQKALKKGAKYLRGVLQNLSQEIISLQNLYSGLNERAILFGNIIYTLKTIKEIELDDYVIIAFRKLEAEVVKYSHALSNVDAITSILKCYLFFSNKGPPKELIKVLINTSFTSNSLRDHFVVLMSKYSKQIEKVWQEEIVKYYPKWRYRSYQEIIAEINSSKLNTLTSDEEIETLAYGLMIASELKSELISKVSSLLFKKLDQFWDKIFRGNVDEIKPIFYEASLSLMSLSLSPYKDSIILSSEHLTKILEAIRWYDEKKKRRVVLLTPMRYYALTLTFIVFTFLIFLFLLPNITGFIISLAAGSIWFLINHFFKKPPIEKD
jgi:hypothetical protein